MKKLAAAWIFAAALAAGVLVAAGQILFPSAPNLLPIPRLAGPLSDDVVVVEAAPEPESGEQPTAPGAPSSGFPLGGFAPVPVSADGGLDLDIPRLGGADGYVQNGRVDPLARPRRARRGDRAAACGSLGRGVRLLRLVDGDDCVGLASGGLLRALPRSARRQRDLRDRPARPARRHQARTRRHRDRRGGSPRARDGLDPLRRSECREPEAGHDLGGSLGSRIWPRVGLVPQQRRRGRRLERALDGRTRPRAGNDRRHGHEQRRRLDDGVRLRGRRRPEPRRGDDFLPVRWPCPARRWPSRPTRARTAAPASISRAS